MRFFHPSAKISIFSEKLPQRTIPHAKAGLHANCTQMATFQFIIYMLKYSKDGVSVLVIIDRRRAKKNGLFPVKAEIVHRRTQKYFPTGVDMSPEEWEKWNGSRRSSGKGRRIESCFQRLCKEVNDLCEHGNFSLGILARERQRHDAQFLLGLTCRGIHESRTGKLLLQMPFGIECRRKVWW